MKIKLSTLCTFLLLTCFLSESCKKEVVNPPVVTTTDSTNLTLIYQGTFTSGAHTTTGTVKLSKDASGKKYLVFENFKTDSGPDLYIYLSEDLKAKNYSSLTNKVINGNFKVAVDDTIDTDKKRKVLIWCKAFSVLFGSADLQ
jgi:hypothetical protein